MRLIWANELKQKLYTSRSKFLTNENVKRAVLTLIDKCESVEARPIRKKKGGSKMTNREWIWSLSDDEWEEWLDAEYGEDE